MFTDVRFTCPTLAFASVVDNAFVYHYTYVSDDNPLGLGATHGAELAGLFGHPEGIAVEVTPSERGDQLSASLQAAWSGFATDGDPGELFDPYAEGATVTLLDVPSSKSTRFVPTGAPASTNSRHVAVDGRAALRPLNVARSQTPAPSIASRRSRDDDRRVSRC